MIHRSVRSFVAAIVLLALIASDVTAQVQQLQNSFNTPPDDTRIMMRWWWFGPAVTHDRLEKEMKLMKEGGIGGFEVNPVYPMQIDGEIPGVKNLKFMSPEFLEAFKFTAGKAKELGLRMDVTLGSGWPYGGPQFTPKEGTGALMTRVVQVPEGQRSVALPEVTQWQTVMAAFVGPANSGVGGRGAGGGRGEGGRRGGRGGEGPASAGPDASKFKQVTITNGNAQIPADVALPADLVVFISGQTGTTGMLVKRPAFGADGNVIDHFEPTVIEKFIKEIGEPVLAAVGKGNFYSFFCDSLEIGGENWTPNMLAEFKKRRGYDLEPLLPALVADFGPKTMDIRHDWLMTCTDLFNEYFNKRFKALAEQYGGKYRIQGYGSPPAALHSYAYADLNEAEGYNWLTFDESRWASSASHLLGRPVTSSETWTWLGGTNYRATPLDMKAEGDRHFLQGINQFIGHGWGYTPEGAQWPGWGLYAAAIFNEKNPWYISMPDIAKYFQRVSHMMRVGVPANDVLVYFPNSDGWANRATSLNQSVGGVVGEATRQLITAGYNLDYFDDQLLEMRGKVEGNLITFGDVKYRAVVLPSVTRVPLATMKKFEEFAKNGGIVVSAGTLPSVAPGYLTPEADTAALKEITARLFGGAAPLGAHLPSGEGIGEAIAKKLAPDMAISAGQGDIGFVHRQTSDAEVYFIANTSNEPRSFKATFRVTGKNAEQWDPMTGKASPLARAASAVDLNLAPYGSTVIVFSNRSLPVSPQPRIAIQPLDISTGWTAKVGSETIQMEKLTSWSENEKTATFSGVATYEKTIDVPATMIQPNIPLHLSLGEGRAPEQAGGRGRGGQGFKVAYDAPVRDSAVVYVNGQRVGSVWAAPYSIDISGHVKPGSNTIKIEVANTNMNRMTTITMPNYNLEGLQRIDQETGVRIAPPRFAPQGLNLIRVEPSGLVGSVKIIAGGMPQ